MKYKLRIYKPVSDLMGDLDHEEFFLTFSAMVERYKELYKKESGLLNPTAWEWKNNVVWGIDWYRISDVVMYDAIKNS